MYEKDTYSFDGFVLHRSHLRTKQCRHSGRICKQVRSHTTQKQRQHVYCSVSGKSEHFEKYAFGLCAQRKHPVAGNAEESEKDYFERVEKFINLKLDELKAQALFEFIDRENCSLIVSPIYSIKTTSSTGSQMAVEVRVKGYPATYTNFRDLRTADSTIVKLNRLIVDKKDEQRILTDRQVETKERTEEIKRN